MARTNSFVLVTMIGLAVLAGCTDAETLTDPGPIEAIEPGQASLVGLVTDTELIPIEGALVGLLEAELEAVTGPNGAFVLGPVDPGSYVVAAQALGFTSVVKRVDVAEGATVEVEFQLEALPSLDPYIFTDTRVTSQRAVVFKLTPECVYSDVDPLVTTCNGIRFNCQPGGNCEVHYDDELEDAPPWVSIIGEVLWEPQSAATGKAFLFDINAPNITRGTGGSIVPGDPYTFKAMTADPPIHLRIDNPQTLDERGIAAEDRCCDWFYRLFTGWCDVGSVIGNCETTPDYGIGLDNKATIYFSIAYREPAPESFSALPDL